MVEPDRRWQSTRGPALGRLGESISGVHRNGFWRGEILAVRLRHYPVRLDLWLIERHCERQLLMLDFENSNLQKMGTPTLGR